MSTVDLSEQEWGQVMSIISDAPWKVANPLLMKIGEQLREQALKQQAYDQQVQREQQAFNTARGGNSQEIHNE
jgi:ABC-type dipeptide/oligopeptide/nickel transport system ATPase component